jgi:hypothetical protein
VHRLPPLPATMTSHGSGPSDEEATQSRTLLLVMVHDPTLQTGVVRARLRRCVPLRAT